MTSLKLLLLNYSGDLEPHLLYGQISCGINIAKAKVYRSNMEKWLSDSEENDRGNRSIGWFHLVETKEW